MGDVAPTPGILQFQVTATLDTGLTLEATRDIEVGVRTDDIVVVAWINQDGVTLHPDAASLEILTLFPPEGPSGMNPIIKTIASTYLLEVSTAKFAFVPSAPTVPLPFNDRLYLLNWMFKYAANNCDIGKCPPQTGFSGPNAITEFQLFNKTSYKLFNRLQIKYLVDNGHLKGDPIVVQRAVDVGITNNPIFNVIREGGDPGAFNGVYKVVAGQIAFLINDGTPTPVAVRAFNALATPLMWSNIGSRIELGPSTGVGARVVPQVYPTYFVNENLSRTNTFVQAPEPLMNFSLNPVAPFIR